MLKLLGICLFCAFFFWLECRRYWREMKRRQDFRRRVMKMSQTQ
ncbi:MAG: hypothetical protein WC531_02610 [Candidatus Paceibacterota bacterium]